MKLFILITCLFSWNARTFDHEHKIFQEILEKNITWKEKQSLVDYKNLRNKPLKLNSYLMQLSKVTPLKFKSWTKKQQLAFLINAYNAFTMKLIIMNDPVDSIKDLGGFFSSPWKIEFISLFGKKIHLDYIEHELIRKNYQEPRIHFALVCASISCPSLLKKAFTDKNLENNFTESISLFLSDRNKNYYDSKNNILYLSKIFNWYGDDFKVKYHHFFDFIAPHLGVKSEQKKVTIKYLDYDWGLNSV